MVCVCESMCDVGHVMPLADLPSAWLTPQRLVDPPSALPSLTAAWQVAAVSGDVRKSLQVCCHVLCKSAEKR